MTRIILGPVLSFRGTQAGKWRVTALIGIPSADSPPTVTIDGRAVEAPLVLLKYGGSVYLRYDLTVPHGPKERRVEYSVAGVGQAWTFTVPGKDYAPRMAYVSCDGFSDPSGIRKLIKAENAVWEDLLCNHDKRLRPQGYRLDKEQLWHESRTHNTGLQRFHLLLMGGDQIYFDSIWEDLKPLKAWIGLPRQGQLEFRVSAELEREIEKYYLTLYAARWNPHGKTLWAPDSRPKCAADAMAAMPTVMMWDDHDIFDGWGSYSPEMQRSPLFQRLFHHARRAFWVFQMQQVADTLPELALRQDVIVSADDPVFQPIEWSKVLKPDKLALPLLDKQPGFSFAHEVGPMALVVADLRTERSQRQVLGEYTWSSMQRFLSELTPNKRVHPSNGCQHLLFLSSVPVVHPKLSLAEAFLDSFGSDHVLDSSADDLKDHWSHDDHEGERKRLIETLLETAETKDTRVTLVSGDVHVAAWGVACRRDVEPQDNWAQIQQLTSTAVVHPSLVSVMERLFFHVLDTVAKRGQALGVNLTAEMMLFPGSNRHVMAARNWVALELDIGASNPNGSKLWATWRAEGRDSFSNHLLAIEPVNLRAPSAAKPARKGTVARSSSLKPARSQETPLLD